MANTPVSERSAYSKPLTPAEVGNSERELFELLRQALEPSFALVRRIGAGGMGIVFLARDPALKRLVAVKVMSPERAVDDEARARFQREAESVAKIAHPNVVAVYSVGELANGLPYIVMQYVDGRSMADRLTDEGPLDVVEAQSVIGQVAAALAAAHAKGIVHRDIKAANILWDDASGRALVSDFGIAALLERESDSHRMELTQAGAVVGTPKYMSPEQLLAERVNEKTDIYSLGLLGYELLAREGPFLISSSPNQMIVAHLRDAPRPISSLRADVDPAFEALLGACLEKDPHARPDAEDIARRLRHDTSVVLEWPPPGLEDLQGAMDRPLNRLIGGAAAMAVPLTIAATAGRDSAFRPAGAGIVVMPVIAGMGAITLLLAAGDLVRITRSMFRAARAGYGWGIIAEVLADSGRDTGALITGEREFASLSAVQRSRIRDWRVSRMVLRAGAGLWLVAGFLFALPVAVRIDSIALLELLTLGVPVSLLITAWAMGRRERQLLAPVRARWKKHRSPIDRLSHLAATWRDAFDRIKSPLSRGHGAIGRIARRAVAVGVAAVLGGLGVVTAAGLVAMTAGNQAMTEVRVRSFSEVQDRVRRVGPVLGFRVAIDPAVSPLDAGYALQSLVTAGSKRPRTAMETPIRSPLRGEMTLPGGTPPLNLLDGRVIELVYAGKLTPGQRAYLERVAAMPGGPELSLLSRARSADWVSAMIATPVKVAPLAIPLPGFGHVRTAALGHLARAALAVERREMRAAERNLREIIGAGAVLMDGRTSFENIIGARMLELARNELAMLFEIEHQDRLARAIRTAVDSGLASPLRSPEGMLTRAQRDAYLRAVILDASIAKGVRWEAATFQLAYQPCGHLKQMLFGPDEVHRQRMLEARRALVEMPGDEQLMRSAEQAVEVYADPSAAGIPMPLPYRVVVNLAGAVDLLTGSPRMKACMSMRPATRDP